MSQFLKIFCVCVCARVHARARTHTPCCFSFSGKFSSIWNLSNLGWDLFKNCYWLSKFSFRTPCSLLSPSSWNAQFKGYWASLRPNTLLIFKIIMVVPLFPFSSSAYFLRVNVQGEFLVHGRPLLFLSRSHARGTRPSCFWTRLLLGLAFATCSAYRYILQDGPFCFLLHIQALAFCGLWEAS